MRPTRAVEDCGPAKPSGGASEKINAGLWSALAYTCSWIIHLLVAPRNSHVRNHAFRADPNSNAKPRCDPRQGR